jgi:hypothetical protein
VRTWINCINDNDSESTVLSFYQSELHKSLLKDDDDVESTVASSDGLLAIAHFSGDVENLNDSFITSTCLQSLESLQKISINNSENVRM